MYLTCWLAGSRSSSSIIFLCDCGTGALLIPPSAPVNVCVPTGLPRETPDLLPARILDRRDGLRVDEPEATIGAVSADLRGFLFEWEVRKLDPLLELLRLPVLPFIVPPLRGI